MQTLAVPIEGQPGSGTADTKRTSLTLHRLVKCFAKKTPVWVEAGRRCSHSKRTNTQFASRMIVSKKHDQYA